MIDQNITQGAIQNPYEEFTREIEAGTSEEILFAHSSFAVLNLNGGTLSIQVGQTGQRTSVIGAGVGFEWIDGEGRPLAVASVRLFNLHPSEAMTVTVGLAMGRIKDSRLAFTGTMNVQNTSATALYVRNMTGNALAVQDSTVDASVQLVEAAVDDIAAMMQNDEQQRAPMTTLAGATGSVTTATGATVLVASGTNVNGIIIRRAQLGGAGHASSVIALNVGGTSLARSYGGANAAGPISIENVFIPAGLELAVNITTSGEAIVWHEVL